MTYKPRYSVPEILKLRAEGMTHREIAEHSSISTSRVGQIIKAHTERAQRIERSRAACTEIRRTGDISRKMPVEELLSALNLSGRAERLLRRQCERDGATELSLLDLMDFLLPVVEAPAELYDAMPAYEVCGIGSKTYAEFINALSALDCGEACADEWAARKRRLRDYRLGVDRSRPYAGGSHEQGHDR